jgi:hypothetical protein
MPIHLNDLDVAQSTSGLKSVLIVPCVMCPSVTVAAREQKPFMRLFANPFVSAPFERHVELLRERLQKQGVTSEVFKSRWYLNWFLCMWSERRRKKLQRRARDFEAVLVLGCDSATETVSAAIQSSDCKLIEGMEACGLTNAKLKLHWPANVSFAEARTIPMPRQAKEHSMAG